jgi:hypothetical protein
MYRQSSPDAQLNGGRLNMTTKTLAGLLREFNIRIVPISQSYRRGARETCARATLSRIYEMRGYTHMRDVLMSFTETPNKYALTAPALWAVSDVLKARPQWFGTVWLEALDGIDLAELSERAAANRRVAAPRAFMATALFEALRSKFPDQVRVGARRRRPADQAAVRLAA